MPRVVDLTQVKKDEHPPEPLPHIPVARPARKREPVMDDEDTLQWIGSFPHTHSRTFAAVLGILAGLTLLFFFIIKEPTATAVFALLAVVFTLLHERGPITHHIELHDYGVTVDEATYAYRELSSFWIEYVPGPRGPKEIIFTSRRWYLPHLRVPLGRKNPTRVHRHLAQFLPEEEYEPTLLEMIGREIGL